jgi:hypothetical protein
MRKLIAIAAALLLAACATPPQQPVPIAAKAASGIVVAGTLSLGECEMSIAALYSRAAVAAERARRRLADGRLTQEQAAEIRRKGLALVAVLDGVCKLERKGKSAGAEHNVHYVRDVALPELEALITGAGK